MERERETMSFNFITVAELWVLSSEVRWELGVNKLGKMMYFLKVDVN